MAGEHFLYRCHLALQLHHLTLELRVLLLRRRHIFRLRRRRLHLIDESQNTQLVIFPSQTLLDKCAHVVFRHSWEGNKRLVVARTALDAQFSDFYGLTPASIVVPCYHVFQVCLKIDRFIFLTEMLVASQQMCSGRELNTELKLLGLLLIVNLVRRTSHRCITLNNLIFNQQRLFFLSLVAIP